MPSLAKRLALLRDHPPEVAAAIMAGALSDADPAEQIALCEAIIATGRPEPLARVIEQLARLEPQA